MNIEEDNELTTEECEEYLDEYMKGSWYAKRCLLMILSMSRYQI